MRRRNALSPTSGEAFLLRSFAANYLAEEEEEGVVEEIEGLEEGRRSSSSLLERPPPASGGRVDNNRLGPVEGAAGPPSILISMSSLSEAGEGVAPPFPRRQQRPRGGWRGDRGGFYAAPSA